MDGRRSSPTRIRSGDLAATVFARCLSRLAFLAEPARGLELAARRLSAPARQPPGAKCAYVSAFPSSLRRMSPSASAISTRRSSRSDEAARVVPSRIASNVPTSASSASAKVSRVKSARAFSAGRLTSRSARKNVSAAPARSARSARTAPVSASTYAARIATRSTALGKICASHSSRRVADQSAGPPAPSAPVSNASRTAEKSPTPAAFNTKDTLLARRGGSTERSSARARRRSSLRAAPAAYALLAGGPGGAGAVSARASSGAAGSAVFDAQLVPPRGFASALASFSTAFVAPISDFDDVSDVSSTRTGALSFDDVARESLGVRSASEADVASSESDEWNPPRRIAANRIATRPSRSGSAAPLPPRFAGNAAAARASPARRRADFLCPGTSTSREARGKPFFASTFGLVLVLVLVFPRFESSASSELVSRLDESSSPPRRTPRMMGLGGRGASPALGTPPA
mmetsp:Transcript_9408/g.39509  ORF Transcript_9408/g.39509 Transcript_9408/m.39509 type:complete len:462 (-) Transcript_9408:405-1790(-)